MLIKKDDDNSRWLLTCFYGHPDKNKRMEAWQLLQSFKLVNMDWCVIEDFNEVLSHDERVGGMTKSEN